MGRNGGDGASKHNTTGWKRHFVQLFHIAAGEAIFYGAHQASDP
jgi:hypothetical protein